MPQLFTLKGFQPGEVYYIQEQFSIGNLHECDIKFSIVDPQESPIKITIEQISNHYQITKKSGIICLLINGNPIEQSTLQHGDIIQIEEWTFLFNIAPRENFLHDPASPTDLFHMLSVEEQEQQHRLLIFHQLSSLVSNIFNLEELLECLANFFLETFHATSTIIFLQEDKNYLKPIIQKSRDQNNMRASLKNALSPKVLQLVTQKNKAVLCYTKTNDTMSYIMVSPLKYQNELLGIVALEIRQQTSIFIDEASMFHYSDLYILAEITLIAANAIANLQRYIERKKHIKRLENLNKITLKLSSLLDAKMIFQEAAKEVCRLVQCTKSSVIYVDKDEKLRVGFAIGMTREEMKKIEIPYGKGLVGWVIKQGRALMSSDIPSTLDFSLRQKYSTSSFIIVPIWGKHSKKARPLGAICITDRINTSPFTKKDKDLITFVAHQVGIALINASYYEQATVDFLTQIYLRGHFLEKLGEFLEQNQPQMSLLMLDIDFFKSVNDTYGHQVGDMILKNLAALLKKCVRVYDVIGRYGGEEFIILLKDSLYQEAMQIGERIRSSIENYKFQTPQISLNITVSIGVAQIKPNESIENLINRCDFYLYEAKHQGRNCIYGENE